MVYKPKKKVNGHKKNDRYTRRRKRAAAVKRRAAALPVRSNVKRYVAEQFGKTHPDNRYFISLEKMLQPTNKYKKRRRSIQHAVAFGGGANSAPTKKGQDSLPRAVSLSLSLSPSLTNAISTSSSLCAA